MSFDEECFTRAGMVGKRNVGSNLFYYNGREGRLSLLKKLNNLDDLKDDRIFPLGSLKIEKTNHLIPLNDSNSYADNLRAIQNRGTSFIEYCTEPSFSIRYKLKEIELSTLN